MLGPQPPFRPEARGLKQKRLQLEASSFGSEGGLGALLGVGRALACGVVQHHPTTPLERG